nr:hypothetical protein [Tanacetum cinerariifolium]
MQTQTSNTLHNAIMEAGSKDRPPMLAPGNYVQWKSIIKRYNDTKPNHELIHYCLKNPPYKLAWAHKEVLISKGIDNDIYSTVDACPNACKMWKAIERLKQVLTSTTTRMAKHQNEVNEIRAEKITRVSNLLVLVSQQQPVYNPQNHPTHYTQNSLTRSQLAAIRSRGKAIVNSLTLIYDQELSMVAKDDEMSKDKKIDKLKEFGHVARKCKKPKRAKDAAYHREKMLLCKQEEADWRDDTNDESDDQELEAHYMYMEKIQEVTPYAANNSGPIFDTKPVQQVQPNDNYNVFAIESKHHEQSQSIHNTYSIEQDKHNVIIDSLDMSYDRDQIDQNDGTDDLDNERELLASLIEKLKCEIDESKNRNKFLETSQKVLFEKLESEIQDFKNKNKSLESSNNRFKEANNKLLETNKLLCDDFKKSQAKLERHDSMDYASKIKLYKSRKDKELDRIIALENKVKVLDNIVYKTGQSVQTMNMLNNKCQTSFAKPEFLKKAQRANPRLHDIGCYNDNLALMLATESDEAIRLEKESRSKLSNLIRPFDYEKLNNLYDLFVPQRKKSSEQRYFSERSRLSHTSVNNGNSKETFNKQTTLLEKRMDESIP